MSGLVNLSFIGGSNTSELKAVASDFIPIQSEEFILENVQGTSEKWKALISCNLKNFADVEEFVRKYSANSGETLKLKYKSNLRKKVLIKLRERIDATTIHALRKLEPPKTF